MFKKINLLAAMLFCVVLFVGCSKANAQAGGKPASESDFLVELTEDNSGVVITGYNGKGGNVVIPDTIEGLPVKKIKGMAFSGNDKIKSVVIPNTVTIIDMNAFSMCENLKSVKFPENDDLVVGDAAFADTGLKSVTFYGNVGFFGGRNGLGGVFGLASNFRDTPIETIVFESGVKKVHVDTTISTEHKEVVFKSPDTIITGNLAEMLITNKMSLAMQQEIKNRIRK